MKGLIYSALRIVCLITACLLFGCGGGGGGGPIDKHNNDNTGGGDEPAGESSPEPDFSPAPGAAGGGECPAFTGAVRMGLIESDDINEASGIAASEKNEDIFWVHNDSGDGPRVFVMNSNGDHLGVYTLSGARSDDWEDIAIGPGPIAGESYLYMGEIGSSGRSPFKIYRLREPEVDQNQTPVTVETAEFDTIEVTYPGSSYNAETLLVDPENSDIYIVTKSGANTHIYKKAAPHVGGEPAELVEVAAIDFNTLPGNKETTGGDISRDGNLIVIRTYSHALIWARPSGGTISDALDSAPCLTIEMADDSEQGEAITFSAEGDLVTVSEWLHQPLYLYSREDPE